MLPARAGAAHDYFLLVPDQACCIGCRPARPRLRRNPCRRADLTMSGRRMRLASNGGACRPMIRPVDVPACGARPSDLTRRPSAGAICFAGGALIGLGACSGSTSAASDLDAAKAVIASTVTVDLARAMPDAFSACAGARAGAVHPGGGTDASRQHGRDLPGGGGGLTGHGLNTGSAHPGLSQA